MVDQRPLHEPPDDTDRDPVDLTRPATASPATDPINRYLAPGRDNATLIYILYLLGLVPAFGAVPILVGFVMALLNRDRAGPLERSHYEYQFRQALIGLGLAIISLILIIVLIGFVGFLLTAIWWVVRSVKGLLALNDRQPIADPKSWLW
jgi:uncharacterized membrane protein